MMHTKLTPLPLRSLAWLDVDVRLLQNENASGEVKLDSTAGLARMIHQCLGETKARLGPERTARPFFKFKQETMRGKMA